MELRQSQHQVDSTVVRKKWELQIPRDPLFPTWEQFQAQAAEMLSAGVESADEDGPSSGDDEAAGAGEAGPRTLGGGIESQEVEQSDGRIRRRAVFPAAGQPLSGPEESDSDGKEEPGDAEEEEAGLGQ